MAVSSKNEQTESTTVEKKEGKFVPDSGTNLGGRPMRTEDPDTIWQLEEKLLKQYFIPSVFS
ncbi:MAG TPA: hypothetical protein VFS97_02325 [Nitrososphaeraceae archaeon]|nr:hypothetical protein [Nitrososphaeraceae archaeon]